MPNNRGVLHDESVILNGLKNLVASLESGKMDQADGYIRDLDFHALASFTVDHGCRVYKGDDYGRERALKTATHMSTCREYCLSRSPDRALEEARKALACWIWSQRIAAPSDRRG